MLKSAMNNKQQSKSAEQIIKPEGTDDELEYS
jgi:hypothetical protein